jgi:phosphate/sulfate permease
VSRFGKDIGAVGFIGNSAVAVIAFFEDADADKSGAVSVTERVVFMLSPLSMKGRAVTEVARQGLSEPDIVERDPDYRQFAHSLLANFASGLMLSGIYATYFATPVSLLGSAVATRVTTGMVKQFFVRKGFEVAVKNAMLSPFR